MTENENIRLKIAKLLQMTADRGCSEGEADNAMRLANKLMEEYRLTALDCANTVRGIGGTGRSPSLWKSAIFIAIAELYGTILWTQLGDDPCDFTFVGESFYVDMSVLMASYLEGVVVRTTRVEHPEAKGREQFKLGMANRLAQRIREMGKSVSWCDSVDGREKSAINYVKETYGITVSYGRRRTKRGGSYYKGSAAGNSVNLQRQATGTNRLSLQ